MLKIFQNYRSGHGIIHGPLQNILEVHMHDNFIAVALLNSKKYFSLFSKFLKIKPFENFPLYGILPIKGSILLDFLFFYS